MNKAIPGLIVVLVVGFFITISSTFTLRQDEQAAISRFSELVRVVDRPGLHFKVPFLDNAKIFKRSVYEISEQEVNISVRNNEPIVIDYYFTYRIQNLRTLITLNGGILSDLNSKLGAAAFSSIQADLDERSQQEILASGRQEVRDIVFSELKRQEPIYGVEIIDFRMNRVDLPASAKDEVEQSMRKEREAEVQDIRSRANASANIILAEAERQAGLIRDTASQRAQSTIGLGTQLEIELKNQAFGIDPDFFTFYKRVERILLEEELPSGTFTVSNVDTFLQDFLGYNLALASSQNLSGDFDALEPLEPSEEIVRILNTNVDLPEVGSSEPDVDGQ